MVFSTHWNFPANPALKLKSNKYTFARYFKLCSRRKCENFTSAVCCDAYNSVGINIAILLARHPS